MGIYLQGLVQYSLQVQRLHHNSQDRSYHRLHRRHCLGLVSSFVDNGRHKSMCHHCLTNRLRHNLDNRIGRVLNDLN